MEIRQSLAKAAAEGIGRLMDRVHEATEELLALWLSPSHVTIEELLRSYALEIEEMNFDGILGTMTNSAMERI